MQQVTDDDQNIRLRNGFAAADAAALTPCAAQADSSPMIRAEADETHRHGLKITAHAHGTEGIIAASGSGSQISAG